MDSTQYDEDVLSERDVWKDVWRHTTTTVGLVTSHYDGESNVMACEWAIQNSFRPLEFLIVVGKSKKTAELILQSDEFGITFASDDQAPLSHIAGSYSGHNVDKFEKADFNLRPGNRIDAPIIQEGMVAVECKVIEQLEMEERYIFVGRCVHAETWDSKSPLIYHGGKYYELGDNIPKS